MKSQILTLLVLIIGVFFFRPTQQYRLSKRQLTEYDLTSFIVGTCSAAKTDAVIQNLCDQTLQSALLGNFPYLIYYCETIGAGMTYCNNINQYVITNPNVEAKSSIYRRVARSLDEDENEQNMDMNNDVSRRKMIMQMCIIKTKKNSVGTNQFCNQKLQEVQQGWYPEINRLCKSYPEFDYCQQIQAYSSSLLIPAAANSILSKLHPSFAASAISKPSDSKSIVDQEKTQ